MDLHTETEAIFMSFNTVKLGFYSSLGHWKFRNGKDSKRLIPSGRHAYINRP